MKNTILLNLAILLVTSALAPAATRLVPDEYATIQTAIDDCNNGDTVIVAPGTYTGYGNCRIEFLGKSITVRSTNPNDPNIIAGTIIDCKNVMWGFHFNNGEDANSILDGFTITNGGGRASHGGGIYCYDSSPTIANCTISSNRVNKGGGIYCREGSPTITNCKIIANTAYNGGGIYCESSSPTITNCTISGNSALGKYGGGGIYCESGSPTITNCTISWNRGTKGGGIYCGYYSDPTVTNCTISGNSAEGEISGSGGGIHCGHQSSPTITNCTISGNSAEGEISGNGGGIYCESGSPTITNCTIIGNKAACGGGILSNSASCPTATNCIVWANNANEGNQIGLGSSTRHTNSILTIGYSDVQGGENEVFVGPDCMFNWGPGNMDAAPCFVLPGSWADVNDPNIIVEPNDPNAVWVEGDYHLLEDSPCINAGDPNFLAGPEERDIDGEPRVWDGRVDMGADEFVPALQVAMKFTPQALNPKSKGNWVKAHFVLPEGFIVEDVDVNRPAVIEPLGIESDYIDVFINEDGLVEIEAGFDRAEFCAAGPIDGTVTVIGALTSGQYFYGTDTIKIITNNLKYLAVLASHWLEQDCCKPAWCDGLDVDQDSVVNFVDFAMFDGCCIEIITE